MNLEVMRQARDDVASLTEGLQGLLEAPLPDTSPETIDNTHNIARTYVQLIGEAVTRFEEAASGS